MPGKQENTDTFVVFKPESVDILKGEDNGRRIGGYCSTEALDRQQEIVFGKGLDFSEFLNFGYYNDNHNQKTASILGVPDRVRYDVGKGWWSEGHLIKTKAADEIYELAKALNGTKRKLGFSIEGKITERDGNKIKKAIIRNVAITNCPVNTNCTWDLLSKAFTDGIDESDLRNHGDDNSFIRSMITVGTGPSARVADTGARVLAVEDLEQDKKKKKAKKSEILEPGELTHIYKCSRCEKGFSEEEHLDSHDERAHRRKSALTINTFELGEVVRTRKGLMTAQEAVRLIKSNHPDWETLTCVRAARFALLRSFAQKGGD